MFSYISACFSRCVSLFVGERRTVILATFHSCLCPCVSYAGLRQPCSLDLVEKVINERKHR